MSVESWECAREYKFDRQLVNVSLKVQFVSYFYYTFIIY